MMENFERAESPPKNDTDDAESKLRALERNQSPNTAQGADLSADAGQHAAVDTSQEWWNKKDEKPQPTLLEQAKEAVVIGAAGVILVGSGLLLGHEAMENNAGVDNFNERDVSQTQVIDRPAASQAQFVETNQPYTLSQDALEATPSAQVDSAPEQSQADWWRSVPEYSQHDLTYKGANTEYGCAPSSASMVLGYWHQQNPENLTMSAQDLLDSNVAQGEFDRFGMSSSNIHDDVSKLGYTAQDHTNSSLDELKSAVADGPVIAIVKLGMKTDGTNHSVVVTGISDQNEVRVNDPWTGKAQTYSWEQFSKSWGANFGKDAPTNSFTLIKPKQI